MPYITPTSRQNQSPSNEGELNYKIHQHINTFLEQEGHNYSSYNSVIGLLESIKLKTILSDLSGSLGQLRRNIKDTLSVYKPWTEGQGDDMDKIIIEVAGVLQCIQLEFYARLVRPYEDGKILLNGDCEPYLSNAKTLVPDTKPTQQSYTRTGRSLGSPQNDAHAHGLLKPYIK